MNEANLIGVRIYGEKRGDLWVLVTLDFGLGTQARTLAEALERINRQIEDYLFDAYFGSDNEFRSSLISRKAPFYFFIKYYWTFLSQLFHKLDSKVVFIKPFNLCA